MNSIDFKLQSRGALLKFIYSNHKSCIQHGYFDQENITLLYYEKNFFFM